MWIRTWVLRLKSKLNRLPHPSKVHWNGFSPVWTSWCLLSLELSTKALPHSAHTCTRGPCVCKCLRIALLSRNIFVQPLCGHAIVRSTPSRIGGLRTLSLWPGRANSASCFGSERSSPGIPSATELAEWLNFVLDLPVIYSVKSGSGSGFEPSSGTSTRWDANRTLPLTATNKQTQTNAIVLEDQFLFFLFNIFIIFTKFSLSYFSLFMYNFTVTKWLNCFLTPKKCCTNFQLFWKWTLFWFRGFYCFTILVLVSWELKYG